MTSTDPTPIVDFYQVREDGAITQEVVVLRFTKVATGEHALLRYGVDAAGHNPSTYALVRQGERTLDILLSGPAGARSQETSRSGSTKNQRRARNAPQVTPAYNPDEPGAGIATDLCRQCPVICQALVAMECGLLVIVTLAEVGALIAALAVLKNVNLAEAAAVAGVIVTQICEKPAEAACGPFCLEVYGDLLQDDPANCGACGTECPGVQRCCGGHCKDTRTDPEHCGKCGTSCSAVAPTCCASLCVNLNADRDHCGRCGKPCASDKTCQNGVCTQCADGGCCVFDTDCDQSTANGASTGNARRANDVKIPAALRASGASRTYLLIRRAAARRTGRSTVPPASLTKM